MARASDRDHTVAGLDVRPLPFGQRSLWLLWQIAPDAAAYNMSYVGRIRGPIDSGRLAASLDVLVDRHEVLRTVYAEYQGEPRAIVARAGATDCSLKAATRRDVNETAVLREIEADAARPFDLATGPLVRPRLYSLAPDLHLLAITAHHITTDAW